MTSNAEFAWAVGLFEGEGTIHAGRKGPRGASRSQRRLCLGTTDLDVLQRFHAAVGVGKIDGPRIVKDRKTAECLALLDRMEPLLGQRRREQVRAFRAGTV